LAQLIGGPERKKKEGGIYGGRKKGKEWRLGGKK